MRALQHAYSGSPFPLDTASWSHCRRKGCWLRMRYQYSGYREALKGCTVEITFQSGHIHHSKHLQPSLLNSNQASFSLIFTYICLYLFLCLQRRHTHRIQLILLLANQRAPSLPLTSLALDEHLTSAKATPVEKPSDSQAKLGIKSSCRVSCKSHLMPVLEHDKDTKRTKYKHNTRSPARKLSVCILYKLLSFSMQTRQSTDALSLQSNKLQWKPSHGLAMIPCTQTLILYLVFSHWFWQTD